MTKDEKLSLVEERTLTSLSLLRDLQESETFSGSARSLSLMASIQSLESTLISLAAYRKVWLLDQGASRVSYSRGYRSDKGKKHKRT
jgi:hypothetical protein